MGALQPMHLALVLVVVLLVFGPRKLPELARGVGDAIKELQKSLRGASGPAAVTTVTAAIPSATPAAVADSAASDTSPRIVS
jgi:sec-independent protein translocase protein TatA